MHGQQEGGTVRMGNRVMNGGLNLVVVNGRNVLSAVRARGPVGLNFETGPVVTLRYPNPSPSLWMNGWRC